MAALLALCCLAFAAVNDFVFKLFARKVRSRGLFVACAGIVWVASLIFLPDKIGSSWRITAFWGVVSGAFSVSSNLLLIEAMSKQCAGVCSAIFRLNLAIVVPFAVIFFHESLDWKQWLGVAFAILAVIAFMPNSQRTCSASATSAAGRHSDFLLVVLAAILRAGVGLAYKYAFSVGAAPNGVTVINGAVWILCGMGYFWARERKSIRDSGVASRKIIGYGLVSGLLIAGIVYFMAQALKIGDASIVLPIAQMSFLATFFLSVIFLREKITARKTLALILGVLALLLLSLHPAGNIKVNSQSIAENLK